MRRALVLCGFLLGCHFGVDSLDVDQSVPSDGGDPDDANVELGILPLDANLFDFTVAVDLGRKVPDGATARKPGFPCGTAGECDNGLCIDGYCCDDLCDPFDPANKCRACNVPGSEGHCTFAEDGSDPRGLCDEDDATTCGQDGKCDGRGSCRRYGLGSLCGPGTCNAGQLAQPPTCDGAGHCNAGAATASCGAYVCSGSACATTCMTLGCATGATCNFDQCNAKIGLGGSCNQGSDCGSGFCAKGVCCANDCSGACKSCGLPGARGLCLPIPAGTDPLDECAAEARSSCGRDGFCDGQGACRKWSNTTLCAARSCNGDSTVAPRFCDGSGTCLPSLSSSCSPYTCETASGVCYDQPCVSDSHCAGGAKCKSNGKCSP
jgi:hypothetical protein